MLLCLTALFGLASGGMAQERRFVDDAGHTVDPPLRIERVLAAGPPTSVLLYALAPELMVGWVRELREAELSFVAEIYRGLPAHGQLTGRGGTANPEMVLAMASDVIIDSGSVDDTYASLADRVQEQAGIPYVLIDGSFPETAETVRKAGEVLGVAERAETLAACADEAIARLERTIAGIPPEERRASITAVVRTGWRRGSRARSILRRWKLAWNPEVIITPTPGFHAALADDPLWAGIDAVQDGRLYRAPMPPFGWFDSPPGINRLIGVAWLSSILYPEHSAVDLRAEARDFYRLLYHVELDDAAIDQLLEGAEG